MKLIFNSDLEDEITSDLGRNHFGPGTKPLRTWRTKLSLNSSLEDEIAHTAIRTWRTKLSLNSDLEDEITSDLQDEIGMPQDEIEMAQDEIGFLQDEIGMLQDEIGTPHDEIGMLEDETDTQIDRRGWYYQPIEMRGMTSTPHHHHEKEILTGRDPAAGWIFAREIVFDIPNMADFGPPAGFSPER
eukprot:gene10948-biopygen8995